MREGIQMMTDAVFPDYDRASKMAWETLIDAGITKFPFSLQKLFERFPRIRLYSYQEYADQLNYDLGSNKVTPEDIGLMVKSDDGATQKLLNGEKYNVLYDGDCSHVSVQRIRFTLAHELGHYVLRHFFNATTNQFERSSLHINTANSEEKAMEQEANRFARELLAPIFVLDSAPNKSTAEDIGQVLDISRQSAQHAINYYNDHTNEISLKSNSEFREYFAKSSCFVRENGYMPNNRLFPTDQKYFFCGTCLALHKTLPHQKYCIFCAEEKNVIIIGSKNYWRFHEDIEEFADYKPFVSSIRKNAIPDKCPWCGKYIIDPEERLCTHCGAPVRNQCVPNNTMELCKTWDELVNIKLKKNHGKLLPPYAEYCPLCGSETMYTRVNKLFKKLKQPSSGQVG